MGNEKTGIEYQFMYVSVSEKDTELLERSVFKCLDMYLLMRYGGLLQLADLIQDDRVENEQIFPELQKICIEGILEPKDWKIIEKEIFEYKKQLVLSEIEEVIFEIYVNSFHRIQDGVTLEEMLGFLLTFLAEEKRELLRERCEKNGAYKK